VVGLTIALLGLAGALAAAIWFAKGQVAAVLRSIDAIERPESGPVTVQLYEDAWIHEALKDLHIAVDEGIEHASRSERRVRAVVASAKRRFESEGYVDPGVEAEAGALPLVDDDRVGDEGMRPLSNDVAPAENPFSGIPGSVPAGWTFE